MTGAIALQEIQEKKDALIELATNIWENPELGWQEEKACAWSVELLEKEGFEVEKNYCGIPTAFRASWGSGKPVIGFLGEYDALPNLSQKVVPYKEEAVLGAPGHGCGHSLMTSVCIGAALGMKKEMAERNLEGTVVVYGCPAEEVLTGKIIMAYKGAFKELDIAYSWHAQSTFGNNRGTMAAVTSAKFHFKGRTSHAGGEPWNGRSALDAAELMNVGANFLREHVPDITRMHYAFTDVQGAPNVVHDKTSLWYYVRALSKESTMETYHRLVKVAQGAALMTETEVEIEFNGSCYETMQNNVLLDAVQETLLELPLPEWSEEEIAFAAALNSVSANYDSMVKAGRIEEGLHLDNKVAPIVDFDFFASNDVADVMHIVPCVAINTASANLGAAVHSWQITACSGHSIGHKAMIHAGGLLAVCGLKAIENPEIIEKAKAEFDESMKGRVYEAGIPDDLSMLIG